MGETRQRYDVFLSYSHADSNLAERLSRRMRRYRPPRKSGLGKRRLMVFRDVERLTAAPDLNEALEAKLRESRHLVLLASPEAAGSPYVDLEVRAFLERAGPQEVIVVLCRGESDEALPPTIAGVEEERLYIDLRKPGRRNFRLQTLRLIAALLGVEYSDLRREDDERRRRIRNSTVLAALCTIFLLGSAYLVAITDPEGWQQLVQPETRMDTNALAPVEVFAVRRDDPRVVAWLGRNARHARDLDDASWRPDRGLEGFEERTKEQLGGLGGGPAASLDLAAGENGELGRLRVQLFGFRVGRDRLAFARSGFVRASEGGSVSLPLAQAPFEPFDLEPEIGAALRDLGLGDARVRGTIVDHTDGDRELSVEFHRETSSDDMREVLDAVSSPEFLVFTNDVEWSARLAREQELTSAWDTWDDIVQSGEWLLPGSPTSRSISLSAEELDREDTEARIDAMVGNGVDKDLARELATHPGLEPAGFYTLRIVSRGGSSVATVKPFVDSHEIVRQPKPLRLFTSHEASRWWTFLGQLAENTEIRDVVPVDASAGIFLVVTDREGIFRTSDRGASWLNIDFGRDAFVRAERVDVVVAPGPTLYALAVLSTEPEGDLNPLFVLRAYTWLDRWRMGLVNLLREE